MLDFVKYLPLGWRDRDNACTPKGPRKFGGRPIRYLIGGSRLALRAPRHRPDSHGCFNIEPKYRQDELSGGLLRYAEGVMATISGVR